MDKHDKYKKLVSLIYKFGEKYPKRHGEWIRLQYINDYYFCMDSWNNSISLVHNAIYENEAGFSGKEEKYLGIDWGGFELSINEELLDFYLENLKNELRESGRLNDNEVRNCYDM